MNISNLLKNKYFRFGVALFIYILFVIWLWNFWFLLGIPVVYDLYVSKKVNWSFWKSRKKKNNVIVEWLDALIFAVVAVSLINIFLFQNYKIPTPSSPIRSRLRCGKEQQTAGWRPIEAISIKPRAVHPEAGCSVNSFYVQIPPVGDRIS